MNNKLPSRLQTGLGECVDAKKHVERLLAEAPRFAKLSALAQKRMHVLLIDRHVRDTFISGKIQLDMAKKAHRRVYAVVLLL